MRQVHRLLVGSLPAGFVSAVNYVVNYFDQLFTNPVTVNIAVGYGEIDGYTLASNALGESLPGWKLAAAGLVLAGLVVNLTWPKIAGRISKLRQGPAIPK